MPKSPISNKCDALDAIPPVMRNTTVTLPGALSDRYSAIAARLKIKRELLFTRALSAQADYLETLLGMDEDK